MKDEITAVQKTIDTLIEFCVGYGFQVIGAIVILILGAVVAGWVAKLIFGMMQRKSIDITLSKFLSNIVKILIIVFAVIIALGKFGITIAPFVAALGAAAFGASFALQGPLSNYSAGFLIIMTRPFIVGNTISVAGVSGIVEEIKLACTILTDEEGEMITIPNKSIIGEILHNSQENKIVQGVIGISYDSSPEKAISIIQDVLSKNKDVNSEKDPNVGIKEFADSSVNIGFRYWVPTVKYFHTSYAVNLAVFTALKDNDINIPFPQRDVRIISKA
ncbi:MAG: mechanosensitive ion channel [Proteobacteria bacterium]|nr:mechanosensitive ion channel [Pseudomonadota bacterium]MBU1583937.1 mechanosensitive ion channel [Pseudomonadota bacterium]MBU2453557.1 mechanosensitive ion channel [Pseudomonadota bacterium]MBU2630924.1 mechanosensitive ion channel [Pseudomonadota bacterium]